ncbi:protein disulfide-isomerase A1 [Nematocida sp. LUAm3]|nr:protein disulfide-isomerase A1 [Nematocida sp. LUAm3]KAI5174905.1 protein disulfide-isomerase A1 [Nematocida sp. LUAm2]KAI5177497.1 protein disulfide-isomerase A1 [Nematocida sp. LUAm1]
MKIFSKCAVLLATCSVLLTAKETPQLSEMDPSKDTIKVETENTQTNHQAILFTDSSPEESLLSSIKESLTVQLTVSSDKKLAEEVETPFPGFFYSSEHGKYSFPLTAKDQNELKKEILMYQSISSIPLFSEIKQENYMEYEATGLITIYLVGNSSDISQYKWVEEAAEKHKNHLKIALLDFESTKAFLSSVGVTNNSSLSLFVITVKEEKIFKFIKEEVTSSEQVDSFMQGYLDGTLEPFLMKEEVSPQEALSKEGVHKLNRDTLEPAITNQEKDTLVLYHMENCHFCKQLMPDIYKLAEELKAVSAEHIQICVMEMTKNDVPLHLNVKYIEAYPTIRLYKKGTNEETQYTESMKAPLNGQKVLEFLRAHTEIPEGFAPFPSNSHDAQHEHAHDAHAPEVHVDL